MDEILIFGHKNPDTDSICSAMIMENFEKKMGNNAVACCIGDLNKETKFVLSNLKLEEPRMLESIEEGTSVILVDHNEFPQSIKNIEKANILKVVDHHRISNFITEEPIYYRSEPVGCTATVLYKLYLENDIKLEKNIATLMLAAIISDTLLFKSPTCTKEDIKIATKLGIITNINIEEYGINLLKAGTDLSDIPESKLINLDAKEVMLGTVKTKIAQVNTVRIDDILIRKEKIEEEILKEIKKENFDLFFFAITDILECNSQVIALGKRADLVEKSYSIKLIQNTTFLKDVVSRKKQIIPTLTKSL